MSFYRTYRPQVIDEIDNEKVREALLSLLSKPKKDLPHAYFFSGPRGAGKTTAARVIAKLFNCEKPGKWGACGACEQCVAIAEGKNLDVLELDAASNRGIDEIRALRDGISLAPVSGKYKVYIIDEVHMLTTEAFNALLKTLEEPPAHAVFVLATTDREKVPVTITSRCVSFVFTKASVKELISALKRIVKEEKLTIDDDALTRIAQEADGSFRDAVKYLEQLSFHKGVVTVSDVERVLSLSAAGVVGSFLAAVLSKDARSALSHIETMSSAGTDIKSFITQCLRVMEEALVERAKGGKPVLDADPQIVKAAVRKFAQAYVEMKTTAIPQLPLELAVIELCEAGDEHPQVPKSKDVSLSPEEHQPRKKEDLKTQEKGQDSSTLTVEKLADHWPDLIAALKPYNHSVAGVMRSTRPKAVEDGIVVIETYYTFHKDKLSESKTRDILCEVLKKLFGEKVKVEVVLGKK